MSIVFRPSRCPSEEILQMQQSQLPSTRLLPKTVYACVEVSKAKSRSSAEAANLNPTWSEASSNIRAVWHSDELVVWNRPIAPGVHGSSAHLAVPRMPIAGRGLVIGDFIQRPTMGALEGLSHPPSIGAIVLFVLPVGSGKSIRLPPAATNSSRSVGTCLSKGANGCPLLG